MSAACTRLYVHSVRIASFMRYRCAPVILLMLPCRQNEALIEKLSVPLEGQEPLHFNTKFPQHCGTQFRMIFWKFWMSYWRNPQYNATRFLFAAVLAFLLGSILWKVGHKK